MEWYKMGPTFDDRLDWLRPRSDGSHQSNNKVHGIATVLYSPMSMVDRTPPTLREASILVQIISLSASS